MQTLFFDPFHGAAGDMTVGALLDLGADIDPIAEVLAKALPDELDVRHEHVVRRGIKASKFVVEIRPKERPHRRLADLLEIVDRCGAGDWVKETARKCFRRLCEAEAEVHGASVDDVHLHEAGAADSVADVLGALVAVDQLAPGRIACAPIALGHGTIRAAHGVLPVPAPATLKLLAGFPTRDARWGPERPQSAELCTPTGALLLTELAEYAPAMPAMEVRQSGYGAGTRDDRGVPNVLRVVLGEQLESAFTPSHTDPMTQIECVVDDMAGEALGYLAERLPETGAVEVTLHPVQTKKNRSGLMVRVLTPDWAFEQTVRELFRHSTTFGVRYYPVLRRTLERKFEDVLTPWGRVRVKVGLYEDGTVTASPEYEDCARLAREHDVPLSQVYAAALHVAEAGR